MTVARSIAAGFVLTAMLPALAGSLAPALSEVLTSASADDPVPVVVLMQEFPERQRMLDEVHGMSAERRRAYVIARLKAMRQPTL